MTTIQYEPKHNVFVYDTDEPLPLGLACPEARQLHNGYVIVPNKLDVLQRLAARGLPVPMPMQGYDWPIRAPMKPLAIQKAMSNFLLLNPHCFNLSEMRTGKTLGALWAADFIMSEYKRGECRTLIIGQLSTLWRTWEHAIIENFLGRRKAIVVYGNEAKRRRLLDADADFYIINYEGLNIGANEVDGKKLDLAGFSEELAKRLDIRIVVVDEASAYSDPGTFRHKVGRRLLSNREYLWQLTGTPTPTAPTDAYGLARLQALNPIMSATGFKKQTMLQISKFKWVAKTTAKKDVAALLKPAIRFTQKDAFDAPQCVIVQRDAALSDQQSKLYKFMKKNLTLAVNDKSRISAVNEASLRSKLIQISCGAVYDDQHRTHFIDAKPRLTVLKEIIAEAPKKVIILAPLTGVVDMLSTSLAHIPHVLIDGRVVGDERNRRLRDFQEADACRLLIANPGPIARGLDLTVAATIVWFAATDKPEDYTQANQRINGPKQTHKMTIVQIAATPIEREIYRRLEAQENLQGAILKMTEDNNAD